MGSRKSAADRLRRRDLIAGGLLLNGVQPALSGADDFRPLFDSATLHGWKPQMGSRSQPSLGSWKVLDGVIVGGQDPPGLGSYLVTDETFGDFELQIEARPDWPADTGILVRTVPQGNVGFQILLDHRSHGGIGSYFGNGVGGFHAYEYAFGAETDPSGRVVKFLPEKPSEPTYRIPLDFAAPVETFLRVWKAGGWNQFRIRSVGELPRLTTWINGEKISELDTSRIQGPGFDPNRMGGDRWGAGLVCRWRNISTRTLSV